MMKACWNEGDLEKGAKVVIIVRWHLPTGSLLFRCRVVKERG
ncbi:MAG: hypothetical protein ACLTT1_19045 [[Clostridium] scindens]